MVPRKQQEFEMASDRVTPTNERPLSTNTISRDCDDCDDGIDGSLFRENSRIGQKKDHGALISILSNLSIQYNLGVIAPALLLLDPSRAASGFSPDDAAYPRSEETDALLKSVVFAGAIFGQCTMGLLGDAIGSLEVAMILTNFLALTGTIGCTIAPLVGGKNAETVYTLLAISRCILGVGVGGKYPLSSAISAQTAEAEGIALEHDSHDAEEHRAKEVAQGFFWQTPGAILPYIVSLLLLLIFGGEHEGVGKDHMAETQMQYVILVGFGAIPSSIVVFLTWDQLRNELSVRSEVQNVEDDPDSFSRQRLIPCRRRMGYRRISHTSSIMDAIRSRSCWRRLAGTGLSWALFDIVYYGTAFNLPEILSQVFGRGQSLISDSWRNAFVSSMGIPGVVLAIRMMEPMGGPKPLQAWGFVSIGIASALLAAFFRSGDNVGTVERWGAFAACCSLIFALNWGCNVSTYVLPIETFPKEVRSTFHGWSAGMGKLGALLGSFFFAELNSISASLTFAVCALCSCLSTLHVATLFLCSSKLMKMNSI